MALWRAAWLTALALALPLVASAQEPARTLAVRLRLPANAVEAQIAGYRLYRKVGLTGDAEEAIELGQLEPGADGTARTPVVFLLHRAYRVTAVSIGPGGESERSNEVTVPAAALRIELEVDLSTGAARVVPPAP